jgi:hypothetical protein
MPNDQQVDQTPSPGTPQNGAVTKTPTEARQGVQVGTMRWVLGISLVLAIVGVTVAYLMA